MNVALGSAVRIDLGSRWCRRGMTCEGVIIEVVLPGQLVRSARVTAFSRCGAVRYVVQTWSRRVVRRGAEMVIDAP